MADTTKAHTIGDDTAELQALWRNLLGQFPRWARSALRWLAGDRT